MLYFFSLLSESYLINFGEVGWEFQFTYLRWLSHPILDGLYHIGK